MSRRRRILKGGALNGVVNGELPWHATFTRATAGTYFDSLGKIRTVAINIPRNNYLQDGSGDNGLLIEKARTNLLLQSRDFQTTWTEGGAGDITFTTGQTSLFDDDAALLLMSDSASRRVEQTITVATGVQYVSMIFKSGTSVSSTLRTDNNGVDTVMSFNTQTGVATDASGAGTPSNILFYELSGGFWFAGFRYTATGTSTIVRVYPGVGSATLDHVQHELADGPSSRIVTTTLAALRAADVGSIDLTNMAGFNNTEGTIYIDAISAEDGQSGEINRVVSISDGTDDNRIDLIRGSSLMFWWMSAATVTQITGVVGAWADATRVKAAFRYKLNDCAASLAGAAVVTDTSATVPSGLNRLYIGTDSAGRTFHGTIVDLVIYPAGFLDDDLEAKAT